MAKKQDMETTNKTGTTISVVIKVADSDERVLQLNADEGITLFWDEQDFRRLKDDVQRKLSLENLKRYLAVEGAVDMKAAHASSVKVTENPFNPAGTYQDARLALRKRRGWHQCWKSPGREFDAAMAGPYKQIRKPTDEQVKKGFEAGEEAGEVLKLFDGEGKVELIATECPQELYEQFLRWMDEESTRRYNGISNDFVGKIEEINSKVSRRGAQMTPIVDSEEVR